MGYVTLGDGVLTAVRSGALIIDEKGVPWNAKDLATTIAVERGFQLSKTPVLTSQPALPKNAAPSTFWKKSDSKNIRPVSESSAKMQQVVAAVTKTAAVTIPTTKPVTINQAPVKVSPVKRGQITTAGDRTAEVLTERVTKAVRVVPQVGRTLPLTTAAVTSGVVPTVTADIPTVIAPVTPTVVTPTTITPTGTVTASAVPTFVDVAEAQSSPLVKYGLYAIGAWILYESIKGLGNKKSVRTRRR
jgi:hypothetical protein